MSRRIRANSSGWVLLATMRPATRRTIAAPLEIEKSRNTLIFFTFVGDGNGNGTGAVTGVDVSCTSSSNGSALCAVNVCAVSANGAAAPRCAPCFAASSGSF